MGRETSVVWSLIVWYFRAKRMMHIKPLCKTHPLFLKLISHFSDDLWMKSFSRFIQTAIPIRGPGQKGCICLREKDFWVFKHQMEEVGIIQICKVGLKTLGVFGWKSRRAVSLLNIKVHTNQPTNSRSWPASHLAFLSDFGSIYSPKNTPPPSPSPQRILPFCMKM